MHVVIQAVDEVSLSCNNILALIEAINVTDRKEEIFSYTARIQENIDKIKNSLGIVDLTLNENFNKISELEHYNLELLSALDDLDDD